MFKVLVADPIETEGLSELAAAGMQVDVRGGLDEAALCEAIADADAVLVRSKTRVTAKALAASSRLRLVTRAGIGVDNVDVAAASRRGVIVSNVPDATTTTTAELAIALLCSLARHVPQADRNIRAGKYERNRFLGTEICGKTLGIAGLGRIGRIVADRALGLKMRVIAYDPFLPAGSAAMTGVSIVDFDTLLGSSDFISIHTPLTDSTRRLFDEKALARCRRGVRIVNAARGGVIDEAALCAAVRSGQVAGAALDVTEVEPLPANSELRSLDPIILTPHLGASTEEAQRRVSIEAARQVIEFAKSGIVRSAVNLTILPDELREEFGPYVDLAGRLGAFAGQVFAAESERTARSNPSRLSLVFRGERFERSGGDRVAAALRSALLAGLLQPALDEPVSAVSAPVVARERGIEVLEAHQPRDRDYMNRVDVEVTNASGARLAVSGTCFGRRPILIQIDGVPIDAELAGDLLVTRHQDRPGIVGSIGTRLGARGVNLDRVDLGPVPGQRLAVGIFSISKGLPDVALGDVREIDGVTFAARARLPLAVVNET
jgi:D-3-phosphoglycerate dehydrogenase